MSTATPDIAVNRPASGPIPPIPLTRVVTVELRKMFDTRSGFWLMASIAIVSLLATAGVIIFAPDDQIKYSSFATAIGFPMAVILPIIAILAVTGEWSQRSGLTTFTLIPHRGRVVLAKGLAAVSVGIASMLLVLVVGVIGNLVGAAISGVPTSWDSSFTDLVNVVLGNVLGLLIGFMLGVLIRNSPGAIVAYFVYNFLLPTLSAVLAANAHWFHRLQPWVDFNSAQGALFNGSLTGADWAHLVVTGIIWLVAPLTVGVWLLLRSEVK